MSGPEALRIWAEARGQFDLLLTDMVMPGEMSGRELAERLIAEKRSLKVVFSSGYSEDFASPGFKLSEGVNFLAKPYGIKTLLRIVANSLAQSVDAAPTS
jgi:CheY-like chemotaxis protein